MMAIETLFSTLNIPQGCITNPDLCQISYISTIPTNSNICCNDSACSPPSIDSINLFDILNVIAIQTEAINNLIEYLRLMEPFAIYENHISSERYGYYLYGFDNPSLSNFNTVLGSDCSDLYKDDNNVCQFISNYQFNRNQLSNGNTDEITLPDICTIFTIDGTKSRISFNRMCSSKVNYKS